MQTKTIVAAAVVIALGATAYFCYPYLSPAQTHEDTSSSKLDSTVVCEHALSYMTFSDAASAQLFVTECKEGKHPEVMEKYKADMNLGAGASI